MRISALLVPKTPMNKFRSFSQTTNVLLIAGVACISVLANSNRVVAQTAIQTENRIAGQPHEGAFGSKKATSQLAAESVTRPKRKQIILKREFEIPGRENRPQDSNAKQAAEFPERNSDSRHSNTLSPFTPAPRYPQVVSTSFDAVTGPSETGAFPPDSMGAVGPTQFIVFVNGRIRSFNKTTAVADGVLNMAPEDFFADVMSPTKQAQLNFTSDPQVRYDRLTKRWILTCIDAPSSSETSIADIPNRVLIAISDNASQGVITGDTVWTFYFIQQDQVGGADTGEFLDYDSLGVDNNALYIGGNMFDAASGAFNGTAAFVVRKNSILNGGPIVVTAFRDLITGGDGPESPRGVDNFDPSANEGYVIGTSTAVFGRLILRRVADPGGSPSISGNIPITVSATSLPITINHLGNTGGTAGQLDALDDRLYAAHIRNGKLWTAHTIAVSPAGIASNFDSQRRDAVRWYELDVPAGLGTPTVHQSGTLFDSATNVSEARQYWVPSVMVSGQGHASLGFSTSGSGFRIDAASNGRLAGDSLGNLQIPTLISSSTSSYNPPGDTGVGLSRRWGDYSFTSLDPNDDMTMWTIQEYCNGTNNYGVRVAKLLAPAPATPGTSSSNVPLGQTSTNVTITGISVSGSGFFDPGSGFANHITATVTGGVVVNGVTYSDSTHVVLNVNTVSAVEGAQDVTITNPDGQSRVGYGILATGNATPSPSPNPTPTPSPTPLPSPGSTPPTSSAPYGVINSPIPGSTLNSSTVTFTWSAGSATAYWLNIGNSVGASDIFDSGQTGGHSWTVTNLPTDGRTLYVRLWSFVSGNWYNPPQDYTYMAQPGIVLTPVISPASGTFKKKVKVTITDGTPGATIRYTTNGSTPNSTSPAYQGAFTLTGKGSKTVKAQAFKTGVPDSVITTNSYKITK